jgi:ABC-2 type transport system permease protein
MVAMLIMAEVLLLGTFWFGIPIRGSIVLLISITSLFLISTLGIGLLISTVANTQQEAFLLTFLTLLPSVFLSGFIYPVAAMPLPLQVVSGVIPLTYFLIVVRGIVIKGVDAATLAPQISALAIFGSVLIGLAAMRFRKRLD